VRRVPVVTDDLEPLSPKKRNTTADFQNQIPIKNKRLSTISPFQANNEINMNK